MAQAHQAPNPHDAEEIMRPYLGKLLDAKDLDMLVMTNGRAGYKHRYEALLPALDKALELLGVPR